jgi:hypothetical protein
MHKALVCFQVKLTNEHLHRIEAERLAARMKQGSDLAPVFDKYERDLEKYRHEARIASDQNRQLLQQVQALALPNAGTGNMGQALCCQCGKAAGV